MSPRLFYNIFNDAIFEFCLDPAKSGNSEEIEAARLDDGFLLKNHKEYHLSAENSFHYLQKVFRGNLKFNNVRKFFEKNKLTKD